MELVSQQKFAACLLAILVGSRTGASDTSCRVKPSEAHFAHLAKLCLELTGKSLLDDPPGKSCDKKRWCYWYDDPSAAELYHYQFKTSRNARSARAISGGVYAVETQPATSRLVANDIATDAPVPIIYDCRRRPGYPNHDPFRCHKSNMRNCAKKRYCRWHGPTPAPTNFPTPSPNTNVGGSRTPEPSSSLLDIQYIDIRKGPQDLQTGKRLPPTPAPTRPSQRDFGDSSLLSAIDSLLLWDDISMDLTAQGMGPGRGKRPGRKLVTWRKNATN